MIINVSRMQEFANCEQLYEFKYEKDMVPKEMDRIAIDFGTAIHEALAKWYVSKDAAAAKAKFLETIPPEHEQRGYGVVMINDYINMYGDDVNWTVHDVEKELVAKIGENTIVGRLDLIAEIKVAGGGLWHVQHKTVGATVGLENYVKKYDLAWHERAYALLGRAHGMPIKGTILNLLRKTKKPSFLRSYIPINDMLLNRFTHDLDIIVRRMESGHRTQNPDACVRYNNRLCPYHGLCMNNGIVQDWEKEDWEQREPDYVDDLRRMANERRPQST